MWKTCFVILCSCLVEVVWEFASMPKSQRKSIICSIPLTRRRDWWALRVILKFWMPKLREIAMGRLENFLKIRDFDDYISFHLGHLVQWFQKQLGLIILNYFLPNLLSNSIYFDHISTPKKMLLCSSMKQYLLSLIVSITMICQ